MRVFGRVHTRRRFYDSVARRSQWVTALAVALILVAGLLVIYVVHTGWGPSPASSPGSPVPVHPVQGRKVYIPPMRPYQRPPLSWPAAQTATVTVAGTLARAGSTPVWVGPAQSGPVHTTAATDLASQFHVSVASQQAAAALGVHGVVFGLAPASGSPGGRLHVSVDYSSFAHAYGGDFASRLHLVELPVCALTSPQVAACRTQTALRAAGSDNLRAQRVGADVSVPGAAATSAARQGSAVLLADVSSSGVVVAATAAPSGSAGDFTVTPFSDASEWVNGASSGTFSDSYPIQVPPVPGGFEPDVRLGYSSQSVDGLTSSTNNQASWVGDGWDYAPGFIEADYPRCQSSADLCNTPAGSYPVTLSLNGTQTPIVGGVRAEADGGATFAAGPGGSWVMTQRDGTKYYFGLNQLPGYAPGDAQTGSVWTVPLWNPPAFPGNPGTWTTATWRWMLDYAVDRHGNAIAYFYNQQTNWYAQAGGSTGTGQYTRGGTLAKITYGFQDGHTYDQAPPGQVTFTTAGGRQDAPADLSCGQGGTCPVTSPTFWTDQQLTGISTQALANGSLHPVDSWSLSQTFPATNDPLTAPSPWLSAITQTGQDGATAITLPPTSFAGTAVPGRVMTSADTAAGYSPITRFRLTSLTSTTGGVTTITYTAADSGCPVNNPAGFEGQANRCFPATWSPATGPAVNDWFNLYAVQKKTVTDTTGGDPPIVTSYTYAGPAWHYNTDTLYRGTDTWDQWRGFQTVTTRTGTAPDPVTQVTGTYFQGMSKDGSKSVGHAPALTLTSSRGSTAEDKNGYAGMTFEEITTDGAGGAQVTDVIHDASVIATTAIGGSSWPDLSASIVDDAAVATYTTLAGGGTRESDTSYTYDPNGLVTLETDVPDTTDPAQSTCTTKTYAAFDLPAQTSTYSFAQTASGWQCLTPQGANSLALAQAHAVTATQNSYDPVGNLTQVQKGTGIIAGSQGQCGISVLYCWTWQTTQTATYDPYGRILTTADADNRKTSTAYTPATGAEPASVQVTDPIGLTATTTYDQARDLPLTVTDPAGYQSTKTYDGLGRPAAEWTPGNPATGPAVDKYSYTDSNTAPSYVTQQTEMPGGGYLTTVSISDSLGQPREMQQQTASGGSDITDTTYNSDGWKTLASSPYYTSSTPSGTLVSAASSSIPSQTGYVYDGAGRQVRQIAYKNGTETWETGTSYGGNYVTVVPPTGGTSQTTFTDGRGLTTAIYQYHAGVTPDPSGPASGYDKTTYSYTPAKQLAGNTDAAGNTWIYSYDLLGRQVSQSDPDAGTTTSSYDAAGQLMSVTDARGKTISYTYDSDARRTGEYDTTGGAIESSANQLASWTWDTIAKGKPTASTSFANGLQYVQQVTGYNSQGLPSGTSVVIPSAAGTSALAGTYTQQYAYAPTGQETSYTDSADGGLPSETVTTGYDAAGEPNSLTGATSYVNGLTYTTLGQPLQYTMGTSSQPVYLTDAWDPQTSRLSEQNTQTGTGKVSIDDLHYAYDQVGNVTSEADTPTGDPAATDVQCFQNDYLGRLVQAWAQATSGCASTPSASAEGGAAPYWNTYAYNVTGGLTSITSTTSSGAATTQTFTYPAAGSAQPHGFTGQTVTGPSGSTSTSYGFDKSGNLTTVTGPTQNQALTWDSQGKLTQDSVTPGGSGAAQNTSYTYDADGNLLLESDPGTTTLYLGDEELALNASSGTVTATRYYTLDGIPVATRTSGGSISYLTGDTQGTSSVAIDAATLKPTRRWFDPYGKPRGNIPASFPTGQKGFIGGTTDAATGLTNLGAREYQPATGTFTSTDPLLNPYNPADLNPYTYAQGNPATLDDPTGQCPSVDCAGAHNAPPVQQAGIPCGTPGGMACNPDPTPFTDHRTGCVASSYNSLERCISAYDKRGAPKRPPTAHHDHHCAWYDFLCGASHAGHHLIGTAKALIGAGATVGGAAITGVVDVGGVIVGGEATILHTEIGTAEAIGSGLANLVGGGTCSGQSFSPDTRVLLASGKAVPISSLKPGDKVLATNTRTGKTQAEKVTAVWVNHDTNLYDLRIRSAARTAVIHTTSNHPFWAPYLDKWVTANKLSNGEHLKDPDGTTVIVVGGTTPAEHDGWMWDLTVPGNNDHDFYVVVENVPILVHNSSCGITEYTDHAQTRMFQRGMSDPIPRVARCADLFVRK